MKIVSNEPLIRRNSRIAQFTGLGGMGVLLVGVYFFVTQPENFPLIWGMVLLGFILSQIGIYYTNRFGRRPRPDDHLNMALKGLDHNYALYHYLTPAAHVLVGPAGVWTLLPRYQKGRITYEKGRWRQRGGGFFQSYLRLFGQESLGRPDLEIKSEVEGLRSYLAKKMPEDEIPPIQAALIFTSNGASLDADQAPTPTLAPSKLKELIRKTAKTKGLNPERSREIQALIEKDSPQAEMIKEEDVGKKKAVDKKK